MDDELVSKFLGGDADDADIARLRDALRAQPESIDALFAAAELERDLGQLLRRPKRRTLWPLGLAAAALLAAGVAFFWPRESVSIQGDLLRDGPGFRARSLAVLRYADGTRLELAAGTVGRLEGKAIDLARGSITADVVKQPEDMRLRTPDAEVKVLGTRFTLSAAPGATRVDVEEGRVRVTRRDGASAEVVGGQHLLVSEFVVRPSPKLPRSAWHRLPGTEPRRVAPPPSPKIQGVSGAAAVVGAWSGAAFDPKRERLILWGGGYSDYHGNELYAFDARTLAWERLTDPTLDPKLGRDANDDGTPNGRATYNGLAWHAGRDRFFAFGGVVAGSTSTAGGGPWTFDVDARKWTREEIAGSRPNGGAGGACAYHDGKIWWADGSGVWSLDGRWTRHSDEGVYYMTGAIDPVRGRWILVGQGKAKAVDLKTGKIQTWATKGGDALLAKDNPGFDYDPVRDRFVAWAGGPVYALDPETGAWSALDLPGAPPPTPNGIFGRWRYVPSLDAFLVVTAMNGPVYLIRP